MTGKADFTEEEWNTLREGPPSAGMIVLISSKGGSFRETWALAKTFAEARKQHGESELLDALVADKPDTPRFHTPEEANEKGLELLRQAVSVLQAKSPDDVEAADSGAAYLLEAGPIGHVRRIAPNGTVTTVSRR